MPIITYAYRLYPSGAQRKRLEAVTEACRLLYNACLAERRDAYKAQSDALRGETIGLYAQLRQVKAFKASDPAATGVHSHCLQVAVADLDRAFKAFFRRVKAGGERDRVRPGYPRFKARDRFSGFGFKEWGNGIKLDGRRLKLSGIGRVAVRWHRPMDGEVKTARIVRRAGAWFVRLACEVPQPEPLPATGEVVGIDVGLARLATLSTGETVENPRWYRKAQKRLRVAQRQVARRKKGGARRRKAVVHLQRAALKVANRRKDFLDKLADDWINRFDRIAIEDLRVKAMARGRFAKSILDAGWSYLRSRLAQKAAWAARELELKDPRGTSRDCSGCGAEVPKALSVRVHRCPCCGLEMDRDENAARNILSRAGRARRTPSSPDERVGPRSRAA